MQRKILLAVPLSLWVSWAAWRGPPPPIAHGTPPQLERSSSDADRKRLIEISLQLTAAIQSAKLQRGHAIERDQLEATAPDGSPYIDMTIPDNPLMPNIASVATHCPPESQPSTADWMYCAETGIIVPIVDGQSLIANE